MVVRSVLFATWTLFLSLFFSPVLSIDNASLSFSNDSHINNWFLDSPRVPAGRRSTDLVIPLASTSIAALIDLASVIQVLEIRFDHCDIVLSEYTGNEQEQNVKVYQIHNAVYHDESKSESGHHFFADTGTSGSGGSIQMPDYHSFSYNSLSPLGPFSEFLALTFPFHVRYTSLPDLDSNTYDGILGLNLECSQLFARWRYLEISKNQLYFHNSGLKYRDSNPFGLNDYLKMHSQSQPNTTSNSHRRAPEQHRWLTRIARRLYHSLDAKIYDNYNKEFSVPALVKKWAKTRTPRPTAASSVKAPSNKSSPLTRKRGVDMGSEGSSEDPTFAESNTLRTSNYKFSYSGREYTYSFQPQNSFTLIPYALWYDRQNLTFLRRIPGEVYPHNGTDLVFGISVIENYRILIDAYTREVIYRVDPLLTAQRVHYFQNITILMTILLAFVFCLLALEVGENKREYREKKIRDMIEREKVQRARKILAEENRILRHGDSWSAAKRGGQKALDIYGKMSTSVPGYSDSNYPVSAPPLERGFTFMPPLDSGFGASIHSSSSSSSSSSSLSSSSSKKPLSQAQQEKQADQVNEEKPGPPKKKANWVKSDLANWYLICFIHFVAVLLFLQFDFVDIEYWSWENEIYEMGFLVSFISCLVYPNDVMLFLPLLSCMEKLFFILNLQSLKMFAILLLLQASLINARTNESYVQRGFGFFFLGFQIYRLYSFLAIFIHGTLHRVIILSTVLCISILLVEFGLIFPGGSSLAERKAGIKQLDQNLMDDQQRIKVDEILRIDSVSGE